MKNLLKFLWFKKDFHKSDFAESKKGACNESGKKCGVREGGLGELNFNLQTNAHEIKNPSELKIISCEVTS